MEIDPEEKSPKKRSPRKVVGRSGLVKAGPKKHRKRNPSRPSLDDISEIRRRGVFFK